jgi:pyruvate/2-oxoglutarate dehydrogenase complex dihydrolipoamide dehydrogenase (E3) component
VLVVGAGAAAAAGEGVEAFSLASVDVTRAEQTVAVGGAGRVAWAEVDGRRVVVDCVVITLGRQPDPELALQALCDSGFSELDQAFVPLRSGTLETSVLGVYVVGDAAGICSAAEAFAEGRLAGLAAVGADVDDARSVLAQLRSAARAEDSARLRLSAVATA